MSSSIYGISVAVQNASSPAFYSVTFTTQVSITQGAGEVMPANAYYTYFSFLNALQMSIGPGYASAGAMLTTSSSSISGQVIVSPPVNVPVIVQLQGRGQMLGEYELQPGQTSGNFTFQAPPSESFSEGETAPVLRAIGQRREGADRSGSDAQSSNA
jgi:hypothetical protein